MLTIKYGLFDKILLPAEIEYILNSEMKQYEKANTIPKKFDMIVPKDIQDYMGMHNTSTLTYIANGRRSLHHDVTDSNRAHLKEGMRRVKSRHYKSMKDHIQKMVTMNAAIAIYKKEIRWEQNTFNDYEISGYLEENYSEVEQVCSWIKDNLSFRLNEVSDEFLSDTRMTIDMRDYLKSKMNTEPLEVLEVLFFLSLFDKNDKDAEFYNDFEAHYIEKYNTIENNNVSDDAQRMMILNELLKFKNRMTSSGDDDEAFEIIFRDNQLCALVRLRQYKTESGANAPPSLR